MTDDQFNLRKNKKSRLDFKCVQPCHVVLLTGELVRIEAHHYQDNLDTDENAVRRIYDVTYEDDKHSLPNELELIDLIGVDAFNALS